eukprot:713825-Pleurochrysis_carterae.AAC.1
MTRTETVPVISLWRRARHLRSQKVVEEHKQASELARQRKRRRTITSERASTRWVGGRAAYRLQAVGGVGVDALVVRGRIARAAHVRLARVTLVVALGARLDVRVTARAHGGACRRRPLGAVVADGVFGARGHVGGRAGDGAGGGGGRPVEPVGVGLGGARDAFGARAGTARALGKRVLVVGGVGVRLVV